MAGTGRGAGAFSLGLLRREQVPRRGCALGSDLECPPEGASESPKEPEPQRLPRPQPWTVLVRDSPSVERGDSSLGLEPEQLGPAGFGELEREWGAGWREWGTERPGWFLVSRSEQWVGSRAPILWPWVMPRRLRCLLASVSSYVQWVFHPQQVP